MFIVCTAKIFSVSIFKDYEELKVVSLWHQFYVTGNITDVFFEDCIFMLNKLAGVLFVIIAKTQLRKLTVK